MNSFKKVIKKVFYNRVEGWALWLIDGKFRYKLLSLYSGIMVNKDDKMNIGNFRRCIHRIEKGLIYKDKKHIFAEDYILETVLYYSQYINNGFCDDETVFWAEAVLDEYFSFCKDNLNVDKARSVYKKSKLNKTKHPEWAPYFEKERPDLSVNYNEILNLSKRRRSVRYFLDKEVSEIDIIKAMDVARYSPSACNRQSFRFLFYNNREVVSRISEIPGGVAGYSLPSIVVLVGSYDGYFDERDVNAPIIDSSLAAMSFMFALETLGLSSVCINWPCTLEREISLRKIIKIESYEFIVMMIGVGWPDQNGKIPYSAKKAVSNLLESNARLSS